MFQEHSGHYHFIKSSRLDKLKQNPHSYWHHGNWQKYQSTTTEKPQRDKEQNVIYTLEYRLFLKHVLPCANINLHTVHSILKDQKIRITIFANSKFRNQNVVLSHWPLRGHIIPLRTDTRILVLVYFINMHKQYKWKMHIHWQTFLQRIIVLHENILL